MDVQLDAIPPRKPQHHAQANIPKTDPILAIILSVRMVVAGEAMDVLPGVILRKHARANTSKRAQQTQVAIGQNVPTDVRGETMGVLTDALRLLPEPQADAQADNTGVQAQHPVNPQATQTVRPEELAALLRQPVRANKRDATDLPATQ